MGWVNAMKKSLVVITVMLFSASLVFAGENVMTQARSGAPMVSENQRPVRMAEAQNKSVDSLVSQKNDLQELMNLNHASVDAAEDNKPAEASYSVSYRGQSAKISYSKNDRGEDTVSIAWDNLGNDKVVMTARIKKGGTVKCFETHSAGAVVNEYSPMAVDDILTDMGRYIKAAKSQNSGSLERKNLSKIQDLLIPN